VCSGQGPCWASDSALVGCFIRFHCHFLIATAVYEATLATGEPSESLQAIAETHKGQGGDLRVCSSRPTAVEARTR
jgi:hypothetical protein